MYSPAAANVGVPERRPLEVLNEAQGGRLTMLKLNELASGSNAAGVNE